MKGLPLLAAVAALFGPLLSYAGGQTDEPRTARDAYEISIVCGGAPLPKQETFALLLEQFRRTHPNARTEIIAVSGDYPARVKVLVAVGKLGDIMRLDDEWTGEHMVHGNVIDLTDRIRKDMRLEDYFLQSWVPFVYKGRIYGVPFDAAVDVIFYNRNHFRDAGAAEPRRDPAAWTDEAFLEAARKLTRDTSGDGSIDRWGFTYNAATTGTYQAQHALWREGGSLYDRDKTKVTMHQVPASLRALQAYVDIRNKHRVAPPIDVVAQIGATAMFHSGAASMMLNANWELPSAERARANGVIDYDVAAMPAGSRGTLTRITSDGWGITKNARSKDRAWELVRWLCGEEAQTLMGSRGSYIPPLKRVAFSQAYRNNAETGYDEGLFAEIAEGRALAGEICVQAGEVADAWTRATAALWLGREDAPTAARRFADLMTPILAREAQQRPFAPSYLRSYGELVR